MTVIEKQCNNCYHFKGLENPLDAGEVIHCSSEGLISADFDYCAAQHIKDWSK